MSRQRERLMESLRTSGDGHAVRLNEAEFAEPKQTTLLTLGREVEQKPIDEIEIDSEHEATFTPLSEEDFYRLVTDIKERGILVPLIIKKNGTLLAGHNRLRAAKEANLKSVPVQLVASPLTTEQEKAFVIKDNLLRRQLTAEQKRALIERLYGNQIRLTQHGGDRKSDAAKIKVHLNLDRSSGENYSTAGLNLAKKIETETGIKAGTAKRIIADIKRSHSTQKSPSGRTGRPQNGSLNQGKGVGRGDAEAVIRAFNSALNEALKKVEMQPAAVLKVAVRHAKSWIKDVERKHRAAEKADSRK